MDVEMTTLDRVDSLAERAYRALREQIAVGGLAPGQRVTERGLALRLGVSATPIREALRRLEQERLVERVSARQLQIAAHSEQALRELMYIEAVLRAAAARIATPKISDDTLDEMDEIVEELERDPETSSPEHQLSRAMRFDALLHGAAGNQVITGLIDTASIFGWALRLRAVRAMHGRPEVGLSRIREHREIVTALRARDAERVETLMRGHLTTGIDHVLKQARQPRHPVEGGMTTA
jgi:DNA-binding GntR family transcriptional regulator